MLKTLTKPAGAVLLSLTLCFTMIGASATPARADGEDAARIIGGILALYAISRIIDNRNDDRNRQSTHRPAPPRLVAPARCFIEGQDRNGYYRGYLRRCMQNHSGHANRLPDTCLRRVTTQRGERRIYGGRCLFQNGWVRG